MNSLVKPIERVVEASEWFVRTPSIRLLHIVTSGLLRAPVLKHLTATELLDANSCPFFVLEAATEPGDDGWLLRTEELRADWESLHASAPATVGLPPLWPAESGRPALSRFGLELGRALAAVRAPMTGLVIVLAPVWVRDAVRWREDLAVLLGLRGLSAARFVVVEADTSCSSPVVEKMAGAASYVEARIDDDALQAETDASLDALKNAPPGATGIQLVGAAGPPVAAPRRPNQLPPLSPEQRAVTAQELGISPALLDADAMKQLRVLVLSAAAAMRQRDVEGAIRLQREARDFCVGHALVREAVVNELVLAGYVLQAGDPQRALELFRQGRARAEKADLNDMAVQAQIAVGSCLLLGKRVDDAAAAYAEAGQLGAGRGAPILAIEAFRMCGQLLASKGREQEATTAFRRAIETAERGGADVQKGSSMVDAARQLAAICRKHGLVQQADSLEAQALAVEKASAEPSPPPPA